MDENNWKQRAFYMGFDWAKRLLDQGRGLKRCVFVQIFNNAALEQKTFDSSR